MPSLLDALIAEYGPALTPQEFAAFLRVDVRTVRRYAPRWGGVEVAPGTWRFFEKRIARILNAIPEHEERQAPLARGRDGQRDHGQEVVPGRQQAKRAGGPRLGAGGAQASGKGGAA